MGWIFHCKSNQMNKIGSSQEISYTISETIHSMFPSENCEECELEMIISCNKLDHQRCTVLLYICYSGPTCMYLGIYMNICKALVWFWKLVGKIKLQVIDTRKIPSWQGEEHLIKNGWKLLAVSFWLLSLFSANSGNK